MAVDPGAILARVPSLPGVYLMKDAAGTVFYLGKSRDLRKRLQQYFGGHDDRFFVSVLDRILADVEVVVTRNEKEALVLENQLIKDLQPRHNVLLKDDKNFLRLWLNLRHPFPGIEVGRHRTDDGARTFGPYHSARSIREVVALLNRVFRLRTCTDHDFAHRTRPCLRHQMHLCDAPCVLAVDREEYRRRIEAVVLFLEGRRKELQRRLKAEMQGASEALDYEAALRARDALRGMERSVQHQAVDLGEEAFLDAVGLARQEERASVYISGVRSGLALYGYEYQLKAVGPRRDAELLAEVLERHYGVAEDIPREVLLPCALPDEVRRPLEEWLTERAGRRAVLRAPSRGPRRSLLDLAARNAAQRLKETVGFEEKRYAESAELAELACLPQLPRRIEGYDISNIQGDVAYGSRVSFLDGLPEKDRYRLYRIRGVEGPNDFAMLQEVLRRRLGGEERGELPDLLLIDGGRGQVNAAREVVNLELGLLLPVVGLAKERTARDPFSSEVRSSAERLVWGEPPVETPLAEDGGVYALLVRIRDEAHRFALTAHRKGRTARDLQGLLDRVPGVGRKRKRELLLRYATIERMTRELTALDWKVPGLPAKVGEALRRALAGDS
jgi:excinuclease ABC subunit C